MIIMWSTSSWITTLIMTNVRAYNLSVRRTFSWSLWLCHGSENINPTCLINIWEWKEGLRRKKNVFQVVQITAICLSSTRSLSFCRSQWMKSYKHRRWFEPRRSQLLLPGPQTLFLFSPFPRDSCSSWTYASGTGYEKRSKDGALLESPYRPQ